MAGNMLRFVFRRFFKRHDLERELNEELASHLAMDTALRISEGESPEAARQGALPTRGTLWSSAARPFSPVFQTRPLS